MDTRHNSYRFLQGTFWGFVSAAFLCILLFCLSAGNMQETDMVPFLSQSKTDLISKATKPQLVIVSGSNAHYGIDSKVLERDLDLPVVNAALSAGFSWPYFEYYALQYLKKGDVVLMPLEADLFAHPEYLNTVTITTAHVAGLGFFLSLDWLNKIEYIRLLEPKYIYSRLKKRFFPSRKKKLSNQYLLWKEAIRANGDVDNRIIEPIMKLELHSTGTLDRPLDPQVSQLICTSVQSLLKRGVRVIFTEANYYPLPEQAEGLFRMQDQISAFVRGCGAEYLSVPSRAVLALDDLLDTQYHPNHKAKIRRTEELLSALCGMEGSLCRKK